MSSATGRPGPSDPDSAGARDRIRRALIELCFERGYRAISLRALVERAGIDEAVFRRHFDDLEDCFCRTYAGLRDELMDDVATAVAAAPSWRDRLRSAIYAVIDFIEADEKRAHLMMVEVRAAGGRALDLLHEDYERFYDFLDRGREGRRGRRSISRTTAEAIGGTIFFEMRSSYRNGSFGSLRDRVPKMMYTAVLPYLGQEAAQEELRRAPS